MSEKGDTSRQETSTQWAEIMGQLVDKMLGKNMAMTIKQSICQGHNRHCKYTTCLKWTISGKVIIATEAYKK
ncbi:MAG: hypothetical protein M3Y53_05705 [Thermoproteota archaeon]|nr:hypothetical protein [Thermoproteota archaeon]